MNDRSDLQNSPAHLAHVRRVGAQVLRGMAGALIVAAAVVAGLMALVWLRSDFNFPGRYLFAVLPLAAAGATLYVSASNVERGL